MTERKVANSDTNVSQQDEGSAIKSTIENASETNEFLVFLYYLICLASIGLGLVLMALAFILGLYGGVVAISLIGLLILSPYCYLSWRFLVWLRLRWMGA
ncbi:hypothetical protein HQ393_01990 [Chitinibacter bivalviorum]|uniref:Uncharacterized protein n=1 Tax=Chitinibacter bivalviorum TaxID=2739434 RepID=A0A7H9BHU3_9NEIS|nr:hypothetical protein [Chitinibacter bivalviorum]QLG87114.1 hypothetical protein HQ393_01990 [Chitinibacter bivalviorum]